VHGKHVISKGMTHALTVATASEEEFPSAMMIELHRAGANIARDQLRAKLQSLR
jgi:hypothetical protein